MSAAPYVSAAQIVTLPLGVSWSSMGRQGSTNPPSDVSTAAIEQCCRTASNQVDSELGQTVRSLFVSEVERGPSHRIGFLPGSGVARMLTNFHPIRKVLQGAVAASAQVPKTFTVIPPAYIYPESPPQGFYGTTTPEPYHGGNNALLINPAYFGWCLGRYGTEVWATYLPGWPHAALTAGTSPGASVLNVDDVTGMVGAAPWINDGSTSEQVVVTDVTMTGTPPIWSATQTYPAGTVVTSAGTTYQAMIPSGPGSPFGAQTPGASNPSTTPFWSTTIEPVGPGVLTLAAATENVHTAGSTVTAVPEDVLWAAALYAKAQALQRGLATVSVPGSDGKAPSTEEAILAAIQAAVGSLTQFRRIL